MKTFTLEDNEAQFVLQVLGQLPTQSGAFPLYQKLAEQFNVQMQADTPAPEQIQEQA
jgi:hypothetical protein